MFMKMSRLNNLGIKVRGQVCTYSILFLMNIITNVITIYTL